MRLVLLALLLSLTLLPSFAEENKAQKAEEEFKIFGYMQLRTELDGRDFLNSTYPSTFTSSQISVAFEKTVLNQVTFFAQFQDSRMFGQTKNTVRSIDNIDLHQGYIKVSKAFIDEMWIQAGRFEMPYGDQRILGSNPWNYINRAWDGVRAGYAANGISFDAFALTHTLNQDYTGSATPQQYTNPAKPDTSHNVYGFWGTVSEFVQGNSIDLYGYYDINRKMSDNQNSDIARYTAGFNYNFKSPDFLIYSEAAYQFGKVKAADVAAYLIRLELTYKVNPFSFLAGVDMISGQDPEEKEKFTLFGSPYGAKHKFNGMMDYFSNTERGTLNLGLNDFFLIFKFLPKEQPYNAEIQAHYFTTNQKSQSEICNLGTEIDLAFRYSIVKGVTIEFYSGLFLPRLLMKEIYTLNPDTPTELIREDIAFWSALQLRARI